MPVDQRLRVISGPDKGLSFQLPQAGSETLGKSRQHNEICLHDPALARVHCQVEMEDGRVVLSDFDSETGTFVNGSRITKQELTHGDVVKIGDTELSFNQSVDRLQAQRRGRRNYMSHRPHPRRLRCRSRPRPPVQGT